MPGIQVTRSRLTPRAVRDSLLPLALLALIALKLAGVITWSWWWVLSPLWLGAVLMARTALRHWRMRRKARMFWRAVQTLADNPDFPGEGFGFPGGRR